MALTVWSERVEPHAASLKDCLWCAYLMGLVYGGFTHFPLGRNTVAEREAFERSQKLRPPEIGAFMQDGDAASHKRYGFTLTKVVNVDAAFSTIGTYIAVTGKAGLGTKGPHAVGVVPLNAVQCLLYNPLAKMNSAPTIRSISAIRHWMSMLPIREGGGDYRMILKGEFSMLPVTVTGPGFAKGSGTLMTTDGHAAATLADVNPLIRLISPVDGKLVKPTQLIFPLGFEVEISRGYAWQSAQGEQLVYILKRNIL